MFRPKHLSNLKSRCPECGSDSIYKSHRRGLFERMVLGLTKMRPYRCRECYERFYAKEYDLASKPSMSPRHADATGQQTGGLNTLTAQPRS
jgi:predicted Zn-ribbon and HTH transcriptional regulator